MFLDLFKQLVPWFILVIILGFIFLAVKNQKRAHAIRYSGRISEIIDRRRNFVIYTIISVLLSLGLIIYIIS